MIGNYVGRSNRTYIIIIINVSLAFIIYYCHAATGMATGWDGAWDCFTILIPVSIPVNPRINRSGVGDGDSPSEGIFSYPLIPHLF